MPAFLTIPEVADALRVPKGTVRYWLAVEKLRGFKPGRSVLIKAEDVAAFVEAAEVRKVRATRAKRTRSALGANASKRGAR
jgi:excisionase family DNA binding protein